MTLKRFPKLLLLPLVLIGLGLILTVPALLSKKSATSDKAAVPSNWQTFKSDAYGYTIQYPPGWQVTDNSSATTRQVVITENNKLASVKIDAYQDEAMTSREKVESAIAQFKERMESEPGLTVTNFKSGFEGRTGGYIAVGEQTINGQKFTFENRGLLSDNGRILIFHSIYRADKAAEFASVTPLIVSSFKLE